MSIKTIFQVVVGDDVLLETDEYEKATAKIEHHFINFGVKPNIKRFEIPKITYFELFEDCITGEEGETIDAILFTDEVGNVEFSLPNNHYEQEFVKAIEFLFGDAFSKTLIGTVWLRDGWVTIEPVRNTKHGTIWLSDIMRPLSEMIYVSADNSFFYVVTFHKEPTKPHIQ